MDQAHAKSHVPMYLAMYVALLALVGLTVVVAHIKTGPFAFPIAMTVAFVKAFIIVAIFMHLKDEVPLIRLFAMTALLWLAILFSILMCDYLTRATARFALENPPVDVHVGKDLTTPPSR